MKDISAGLKKFLVVIKDCHTLNLLGISDLHRLICPVYMVGAEVNTIV
jgi:hypothetical protein